MTNGESVEYEEESLLKNENSGGDDDTNINYRGLKVMPFIIGNEIFEKLGAIGTLSNLLVYLTTVFNLENIAAKNIINIFNGSINFATLIRAFSSDAYFGRYKTLTFCTMASFLDESLLIWYSGKEEKQIRLSTVSKIIPGQRIATFQRYPRLEKEYHSFSLIYNDRSLDLICKDKDEAEIWFAGLKALITRGNYRKWGYESRPESLYCDSPKSGTRRPIPSFAPFDPRDINKIYFQSSSPNRWVKAFSKIISYTTAPHKNSSQAESITNSSMSSRSMDNSSNKIFAPGAVRVSYSSDVS